MTTAEKANTISVIGLGQMGKRIAALYMDAGFEVAVWNRTKNKIPDLQNVKIYDTAFDAFKHSEISIICVHDNNAVFEILESITDKKIFAGKTIVNLTTGSPKEASDLQKIFESNNGFYINGAIQAAPEQMGLESTTILVSGNSKNFFKHKATLEILGRNLKHLGETPSASSAMDLATLTWLYGSYVGLMYAVKLCQKYDLRLSDFSNILEEVTPGYTDFFKYEIDVINRNDYKITQSPLPISVAATQRIADSFEELDVLQDFPKIIASILNQAHKKGLDNEELAAIIKIVGNEK